MDAQDRRRRQQQQPENGDAPRGDAPATPLSRVDESVLPSAGGFGRFQKELLVLTWVPALFVGFSQFSDYFLLAQPTNACTWGGNATVAGDAAVNGSGINWTTAYSARDDGGTRCVCGGGPYELACGLVQNVVTKWDLVCDSEWIVHITKFSLLVGSIFGYLVMGVLADWFGRHLVLLTSVLLVLVFGLAVAFSVNVLMFILLRFFEGFCLAGITLSLYVLRIELCLPCYRFPMTMVASFVVLGGQLLLPGLATVCGDWKVLQAVIICPLVLMLSYFWIFPESFRWLLVTQQYKEAKGLLIQMAKKNKVATEGNYSDILAELHGLHQRKPKKTCIVKMVGTRNLWKNIVVLCVNSLTGYGIHHCFARSMRDPEAHNSSLFHSFLADYYSMAGIAVASSVALCPAVSVFGRRGGLLMFMIVTALASLLQLGLLTYVLVTVSLPPRAEESDTLNSNFSFAFSIIGMFSSHAVSNLSIFFCAEITPTAIRGGGLGLVLASAGFGLLTAPIMELHNQKGYFLHHIIFACCTLICIICILLLPEPRGLSLPEAIADGENYTRKPFLPPRRLGEPRRFLSRSGSRDYSRVHDSPLHQIHVVAPSEIDATVPLTIDPTAFSATDPNGHPSIDLTLDTRDPAVTFTAASSETPDTEFTVPLTAEAPLPSNVDCTSSPTITPSTDLMAFGGPSVDPPQAPATHSTVTATVGSTPSPLTNSTPPVLAEAARPPTAKNSTVPPTKDSAAGPAVTASPTSAPSHSIPGPPATDCVAPVAEDSLEPVAKDVTTPESSASNGVEVVMMKML
ncbi:solute carrier family 22 member 23-like [Arapaima gigas]